MIETQIEEVCSLVFDKIGMQVCGSKNAKEVRKGLSFWFENYNRSNGPIFSIRPSGLKRHIISLSFGAYALDCIEHINKNANSDSYITANAFIEQLAKKHQVKLNGNAVINGWNISPGFTIEVTCKASRPKETESIFDSVTCIMLPLMAAISELIGYEEVDPPAVLVTEEGELKQALINKRERSPRNRLLCLSIHGEYCGVCGFDPRKVYDSECNSILEVHHIEPLSEIKEPKAYDPATDLIPLCPNCHSAIHKRTPAYNINELKELLLK